MSVYPSLPSCLRDTRFSFCHSEVIFDILPAIIHGERGMKLTRNSTPWLTTRRRTCPICKGDVVRSLQRANGSTSPRYTPYEEDQSEDEQDRVAATRNESPSADRPISPRGDEDVEQGVRAPTPRRDQTSGSWLQSLTDRIGLTNSTPAPEEDRRRD